MATSAKKVGKKELAKWAAMRPRTLYLIKQVQYKTHVRLEEALQDLGVTAAQFRILATLDHREKRSSAELARMYGVKPQTMIKQIAILEAKALIRRSVAKANKRVLEVELTEEGRRVLRDCDEAAVALEAKIFEGFDWEEVQANRAFMTRLLEQLGRAEGEVDEYALNVE